MEVFYIFSSDVHESISVHFIFKWFEQPQIVSLMNKRCSTLSKSNQSKWERTTVNKNSLELVCVVQATKSAPRRPICTFPPSRHALLPTTIKLFSTLGPGHVAYIYFGQTFLSRGATSPLL